MSGSSTKIRLGALALVVACAAAAQSMSAHASDGVVLISQSTVETAGGFPYRITRPGSYQLSGSLAVDSPSSNVIEIRSSNVTLDLEGFAITGSFARGVSAPQNPNLPELAGITVRNGIISGALTSAVDLGYTTGSSIEHLHVNGGSGGILAGAGSRVADNVVTGLSATASQPSLAGITAYTGSTVSGNVISQFRCYYSANFGCLGFVVGIDAYANTTVTGNTVTSTPAGIRVQCPATILGNTTSYGPNLGFGIYLAGDGSCTRLNNNPAP